MEKKEISALNVLVNETDFLSDLPYGFLATDEAGNITHWNNKIAGITGKSFKNVVNQKIWDVQYQMAEPKMRIPTNYERIKRIFSIFFNTGTAFFTAKPIDMVLLNSEEEQMIIQQNAYSIPTETGFRFACVVNEITKYRKLERAYRNVLADALQMNLKNELFKNIQAHIESLSGKYDFDREDTEYLQQLGNRLNDIENEWDKIKQHFNVVHKHFFRTLMNLNPGLTQNELRHCAYIKLNLSTKEIARLFNVKDSSVQKSRVRLKKKLGLKSTDDLFSYLYRI
ncbi:MAG: PAS domain-containing protein [Bacteroidetes bacterium]|jgi:DNA-binding CsgD family transcriptional regulator|nr:PAS domain-containing protein [Bacteroidota bacterium]